MSNTGDTQRSCWCEPAAADTADPISRGATSLRREPEHWLAVEHSERGTIAGERESAAAGAAAEDGRSAGEEQHDASGDVAPEDRAGRREATVETGRATTEEDDDEVAEFISSRMERAAERGKTCRSCGRAAEEQQSPAAYGEEAAASETETRVSDAERDQRRRRSTVQIIQKKEQECYCVTEVDYIPRYWTTDLRCCFTSRPQYILLIKRINSPVVTRQAAELATFLATELNFTVLVEPAAAEEMANATSHAVPLKTWSLGSPIAAASCRSCFSAEEVVPSERKEASSGAAAAAASPVHSVHPAATQQQSQEADVTSPIIPGSGRPAFAADSARPPPGGSAAAADEVARTAADAPSSAATADPGAADTAAASAAAAASGGAAADDEVIPRHSTSRYHHRIAFPGKPSPFRQGHGKSRSAHAVQVAARASFLPREPLVQEQEHLLPSAAAVAAATAPQMPTDLRPGPGAELPHEVQQDGATPFESVFFASSAERGPGIFPVDASPSPRLHPVPRSPELRLSPRSAATQQSARERLLQDAAAAPSAAVIEAETAMHVLLTSPVASSGEFTPCPHEDSNRMHPTAAGLTAVRESSPAAAAVTAISTSSFPSAAYISSPLAVSPSAAANTAKAFSSSRQQTGVSRQVPAVLCDSIDLVVALGGDGTMLWVSQLFAESVPPVVGVAMGTLGYLTRFTMGAARRQLRAMAACKRFRVNLRCRLKVTLLSKEGAVLETFVAFNECVIDRGPSSNLCTLDVFCNNSYFTSVAADGLILATPTGSTAYSMSAGGSMVHPKDFLFHPVRIFCVLLACRGGIVYSLQLCSLALRICGKMLPPMSKCCSVGGFEARYCHVLACRSPLRQKSREAHTEEVYNKREMVTRTTPSAEDVWLEALKKTLNWNCRIRQGEEHAHHAVQEDHNAAGRSSSMSSSSSSSSKGMKITSNRRSSTGSSVFEESDTEDSAASFRITQRRRSESDSSRGFSSGVGTTRPQQKQKSCELRDVSNCCDPHTCGSSSSSTGMDSCSRRHAAMNNREREVKVFAKESNCQGVAAGREKGEREKKNVSMRKATSQEVCASSRLFYAMQPPSRVLRRGLQRRPLQRDSSNSSRSSTSDKYRSFSHGSKDDSSPDKCTYSSSGLLNEDNRRSLAGRNHIILKGEKAGGSQQHGTQAMRTAAAAAGGAAAFEAAADEEGEKRLVQWVGAATRRAPQLEEAKQQNEVVSKRKLWNPRARATIADTQTSSTSECFYHQQQQQQQNMIDQKTFAKILPGTSAKTRSHAKVHFTSRVPAGSAAAAAAAAAPTVAAVAAVTSSSNCASSRRLSPGAGFMYLPVDAAVGHLEDPLQNSKSQASREIYLCDEGGILPGQLSAYAAAADSSYVTTTHETDRKEAGLQERGADRTVSEQLLQLEPSPEVLNSPAAAPLSRQRATRDAKSRLQQQQQTQHQKRTQPQQQVQLKGQSHRRQQVGGRPEIPRWREPQRVGRRAHEEGEEDNPRVEGFKVDNTARLEALLMDIPGGESEKQTAFALCSSRASVAATTSSVSPADGYPKGSRSPSPGPTAAAREAPAANRLFTNGKQHTQGNNVAAAAECPQQLRSPGAQCSQEGPPRGQQSCCPCHSVSKQHPSSALHETVGETEEAAASETAEQEACEVRGGGVAEQSFAADAPAEVLSGLLRGAGRMQSKKNTASGITTVFTTKVSGAALKSPHISSLSSRDSATAKDMHADIYSLSRTLAGSDVETSGQTICSSKRRLNTGSSKTEKNKFAAAALLEAPEYLVSTRAHTTQLLASRDKRMTESRRHPPGDPRVLVALSSLAPSACNSTPLPAVSGEYAKATDTAEGALGTFIDSAVVPGDSVLVARRSLLQIPLHDQQHREQAQQRTIGEEERESSGSGLAVFTLEARKDETALCAQQEQRRYNCGTKSCSTGNFLQKEAERPLSRELGNGKDSGRQREDREEAAAAAAVETESSVALAVASISRYEVRDQAGGGATPVEGVLPSQCTSRSRRRSTFDSVDSIAAPGKAEHIANRGRDRRASCLRFKRKIKGHCILRKAHRCTLYYFFKRRLSGGLPQRQRVTQPCAPIAADFPSSFSARAPAATEKAGDTPAVASFTSPVDSCGCNGSDTSVKRCSPLAWEGQSHACELLLSQDPQRRRQTSVGIAAESGSEQRLASEVWNRMQQIQTDTFRIDSIAKADFLFKRTYEKRGDGRQGPAPLGRRSRFNNENRDYGGDGCSRRAGEDEKNSSAVLVSEASDTVPQQPGQQRGRVQGGPGDPEQTGGAVQREKSIDSQEGRGLQQKRDAQQKNERCLDERHIAQLKAAGRIEQVERTSFHKDSSSATVIQQKAQQQQRNQVDGDCVFHHEEHARFEEVEGQQLDCYSVRTTNEKARRGAANAAAHYASFESPRQRLPRDTLRDALEGKSACPARTLPHSEAGQPAEATLIVDRPAPICTKGSKKTSVASYEPCLTTETAALEDALTCGVHCRAIAAASSLTRHSRALSEIAGWVPVGPCNTRPLRTVAIAAVGGGGAAPNRSATGPVPMKDMKSLCETNLRSSITSFEKREDLRGLRGPIITSSSFECLNGGATATAATPRKAALHQLFASRIPCGERKSLDGMRHMQKESIRNRRTKYVSSSSSSALHRRCSKKDSPSCSENRHKDTERHMKDSNVESISSCSGGRSATTSLHLIDAGEQRGRFSRSSGGRCACLAQRIPEKPRLREDQRGTSDTALSRRRCDIATAAREVPVSTLNFGSNDTRRRPCCEKNLACVSLSSPRARPRRYAAHAAYVSPSPGSTQGFSCAAATSAPLHLQKEDISPAQPFAEQSTREQQSKQQATDVPEARAYPQQTDTPMAADVRSMWPQQRIALKQISEARSSLHVAGVSNRIIHRLHPARSSSHAEQMLKTIEEEDLADRPTLVREGEIQDRRFETYDTPRQNSHGVAARKREGGSLHRCAFSSATLVADAENCAQEVGRSMDTGGDQRRRSRTLSGLRPSSSTGVLPRSADGTQSLTQSSSSVFMLPPDRCTAVVRLVSSASRTSSRLFRDVREVTTPSASTPLFSPANETPPHSTTRLSSQNVEAVQCCDSLRRPPSLLPDFNKH